MCTSATIMDGILLEEDAERHNLSQKLISNNFIGDRCICAASRFKIQAGSRCQSCYK